MTWDTMIASWRLGPFFCQRSIFIIHSALNKLRAHCYIKLLLNLESNNKGCRNNLVLYYCRLGQYQRLPKSIGFKLLDRVQSSVKNVSSLCTQKAVEASNATEEVPKKRGKKAKEPEEQNGKKPKEVKETLKAPPAEEPPKKRGRKVKDLPEESEAKLQVQEPSNKRGKKAKELPEENEKPMVPKSATKLVNKKASKETKKEKEPAKSKAKTTKKTEKAPKATAAAEAKPTLQNVSETKWDNIDFGCKKKNSKGENYNLKITSWNVDGLRAWIKKDGFRILKYDAPDILCLQETKCSDDKLPKEVKNIQGYHDYWCSSDKEGYAGVGIYTKEEPICMKDGIDDEEHDAEGRCLTLEFDKFFLVNVYVPNAGRGLKTLDKRLNWNEVFKTYIKELDEKKPVILCGDMNVAHNEIDLTNPKTNKKNAGFTQEERDGMTDFLAEGYVDSFREIYPEEKDVYTFWSYMNKARVKNIGWRLDYFILSNRIINNVCDNVVRNEVYGSDHCPITLFINI